MSLGSPGSDDESEDDLEIQKYDEREVAVNEDDDLAIRMFMKPSGVKTRTLADIINEKITEKKTEIDTQFTDTSEVARDIDPKVCEMYSEVGKLLSRYRSGKIPKAFKVLPQFRNWEQLLHLTNPDGWSAAAMYQVSYFLLHRAMDSQRFGLITKTRYIRGRASLVSVPSACLF